MGSERPRALVNALGEKAGESVSYELTFKAPDDVPADERDMMVSFRFRRNVREHAARMKAQGGVA